MNTTQTRRFQELHLRHVRGEALPKADLAFYKTTLAKLDTQELDDTKAYQESVESRIQELETELSGLQERGSHLRKQLASLRQTPRVHAA